MTLRNLLTPGGKRPHDRLDDIFSRDVLGSVLVGLAAGKIVEQLVVLVAGARLGRLVAWTVAFGLFVVLFVYWERVERTVDAAAHAGGGEES